jgi:hypothetical protein
MMSDKTILSTLFSPTSSQATTSSQVASSTYSPITSRPLTSILNNMSINSPPTRFAKRRIEYLSDMKMYAEKINETVQQFQQSVLEALKRDTYSNDNLSRKRLRKSVGCVYTEDASRQQLAEIEQEKINRAMERYFIKLHILGRGGWCFLLKESEIMSQKGNNRKSYIP